MVKYPTLDLFSGIGGNALALRSICKVIAYCDNSLASQNVLKSNMKKKLLDKAPIFEDVTALKGTDLPTNPVVITAGFPCQDAACSNPKGKGLYGERTGLFFEIMRLVDEMPSVKCLVLENSSCITYKGRGFQLLQKELLKRRFSMKMGVFGTWKELGAPHDRARWVCLATRDNFIMSAPKTLEYESWKMKKEPVPRLIKGTEIEKRIAITRCMLLGNSVVPQQIAMVISQLAQVNDYVSLRCTVAPIRKYIHHVEQNGCRVLMRGWNNVGGRLRNIKCGDFSYQKWATPMHSVNGWRSYKPSSKRISEILAVQIYSDKDAMTKNPDKNIINPCFIEYMMGFPIDWTQTAS
jgi:site-specific DNA-cytosine methylase